MSLVGSLNQAKLLPEVTIIATSVIVKLSDTCMKYKWDISFENDTCKYVYISRGCGNAIVITQNKKSIKNVTISKFSISTRVLSKLNHNFNTKFTVPIYTYVSIFIYQLCAKIQYKLLEEYVHLERQWFCQEWNALFFTQLV